VVLEGGGVPLNTRGPIPVFGQRDQNFGRITQMWPEKTKSCKDYFVAESRPVSSRQTEIKPKTFSGFISFTFPLKKLTRVHKLSPFCQLNFSTIL
jgi:hypothetical protein